MEYNTIYELSEGEKDLARKFAPNSHDLYELVKMVFNSKAEKANSPKGVALRKFVISENLLFKPKAPKYDHDKLFPQNKREIIAAMLEEGKSVYDIAQAAFPEITVKKLGHEYKMVVEYIKVHHPNHVFGSYATFRTVQTDNPSQPSVNVPQQNGMMRMIAKVNSVCGENLKLDAITNSQRLCLEKLAHYLNGLRFATVMASYEDIDNKELFEQEFVKGVWGKLDLTQDDVNLYINACKEIVNLEQVTRELNKLRRMFDKIEEQSDIQMRLSEMISAKNKEYNDCSKRMEELIKRLTGSREERQKKRRDENKSILVIIQAFQEEDERRRMIDMAEKQNMLVKQEADKIESMDEWMGRILGVSKEEVV